MGVSYDVFTGAFLSKISEFEFLELGTEESRAIIDEYMKKAISAFRKNCKYDLVGTKDDEIRQFRIHIAHDDIDELADIISEGMVMQWLKPYLNKQELLENSMSTRDYSLYSPAELLLRVGGAYDRAKKNYTQMIREYSFNHADLGKLHF